ncbi:MAG: iron ABC transporter permease [Anaerolineales bacterium]|nr:iron ABC transporter permease [Anaerolineales bacterium]
MRIISILLTFFILLPILVVGGQWLAPRWEVWIHLWNTRLPEMMITTALLTLGVGAGTFLLGTGLAWLVSAYRFPGQTVFEWLLIGPLAMPSFVLAYVYMGLFDFAGPVQKALRAWLGSAAWFPEIRSLGGAILVLSLVLYPYVYVLARAAFLEQAASTFEAARLMGYTRLQTFWKLVLPLARPSLATGVTLAMLEALTDFGAVRFFSVSTISEGIVRLWEGALDRSSALALASLLLVAALLVILLERILRGEARFFQADSHYRRLEPLQLRGVRAWVAALICGCVLVAALGLPLAQLSFWTVQEFGKGTPGIFDAVFYRYLRTSVGLALLASLLAVGLATMLAQYARSTRSRFRAVLTRLATSGYAMPGAVIAAGVLILLSFLDQQKWFSFMLTSSLFGLVYAYVVRFFSLAYNSAEASLEKVTPSLIEAARLMGAGPARILYRIQAPLISSGLAAGVTLVFVDVLKELPATLLLRPFGMDTLAIWAYMAAAESLWSVAALPSLTLLVIGLTAVLFLFRAGKLLL